MSLSADLSGRVAVVTGATSGIGRATAARLGSAGAQLVLVARTAALVRDTAAALGGAGVAADVTDEADIARVVAAAHAADARGAAIVVHAAGAFELAPLVDTSVPAFDRMVAVNLRAAFLLVRAFVPGMLAAGTGDVVLIGSIAGRSAFAANGAYSASKFGLRGMHAVLAVELRGTGVRATLIEPAATDTPLWASIDRDRHEGLPPREAMLDADAVAAAVLYAVTRPRAVATPNILVERA